MKKTLLAFSVLAIVTFGSCDKEEDEDSGITKEALAGSYKLTAITAKVGSFPEQDFTSQALEDCERDDITTLKTDFTYTYTDAGIRCTPSSSFTGNWGLPGDNKIEIDGDVYTIAKWDGKELHGTTTETEPTTGQQALITVKYTRQ